MDVNITTGIDVAVNAAKANRIALVAFLSMILVSGFIIYRYLVCLH